MAHANTSAAGLSETEYEMVKQIIDIGVLEKLSLAECSIYKVPHNLRKVKQEAYTPELISIGPIHLGNEELQPMQEHKKRYFLFFYERLSQFNQQSMIKIYKLYLESKEQQIRKCYAEKFPNISKEKFVETILLDAVFIMELLLRNSSWKSDTSKHEHEYKQSKSFRWKHSDDYILTQAWLSKSITRDLILLENQIPFFVLMDLYQTVVPNGDKKEDHASFHDLALEYFAFYDTQKSASLETKLGDVGSGNSVSKKKHCDKSMSSNHMFQVPKHFTDLIRFFYLPADLTDLEKSGSSHTFPRTVTKLIDSGVSFEKFPGRRLLDIKFEKKQFLSYFLCLGCLPSFSCLNNFKARLMIPQLKVDHTTECVLRNLIALEQCQYQEQPYICNYVSLVDSLIHTQVDVDLLVEKEVIVHEMGSDKEVAMLVNGLCKHVVVNSTCYYDTINKLNNHYQNIWNRTMTTLWLVYFRDAWRASSTLVGIAFLVYTAFNFVRLAKILFY
ncbi:hypothetical protein MtrunA17_Chr8g0335011 [Medicago truncatula]|uniref:DUF247 domain protein n=1 Tax=Medicago truncatula TaxID=3880 RepID=A0A072TK19_MEDTR|nr:UPF0481 protein At3g47200 [Medicago truncatula]KEH17782.1 DUF247 domain protein [Medicago truncatula]RHN38604.1 hypothetical protein MtrunA17_Chr8g0335011 [Medicago truncatula]